jgi:hypothetical protein
MKKAFIALAAVATIAAGTLAVPTTADARCRGACVGAAVGLGVVGGLIAGSAIANSQPRYAPAPGYVAYDGYYQRGPSSCPGGYWARRPRYDQWGNVVAWSKPRYFCP